MPAVDSMTIGRVIGNNTDSMFEAQHGIYEDVDKMLPGNCFVVNHVVVPYDMSDTIEQMVNKDPFTKETYLPALGKHKWDYHYKETVVVGIDPLSEHNTRYTLMYVYDEGAYTTILNAIGNTKLSLR